eukprot:TRINITY_DN3168_c0_g1_i1.p1 TRINITY_DN3168_c0_g1~~TRINITY_DN3168_c0_g1_i1.p1  ORF type:complete len:229 (-),score=45.78 TRINITY_DN3168_c0_g1_i1:126-812(-)
MKRLDFPNTTTVTDINEPIYLENTWCFYHDKFLGPGQTAIDYEASLQKLCTFNTIQGFWNCYNNLPEVEKLKAKSSFHLMKHDIRPIWEDPNNVEGGFWAIRVKKEDTSHIWKELLLAAIGEQFSPVLAPDDDICGATVSIRQYDNIVQVWNKNSAADSTGLITRLKFLLPGLDFKAPYYKANKDHAAFDPSFKKPQGGSNRGGSSSHTPSPSSPPLTSAGATPTGKT